MPVAASIQSVLHRTVDRSARRRTAPSDGITRIKTTPVEPAGQFGGERRPVPSSVGPYRLIELIGEGGMGQVFRAEHVLLGREVAVKVLRSELTRHPGALARFVDEGRAANLTRSEYVVNVTDLCLDAGGATYLVMELLDGEDLGHLLGRQPLSLLRSLCIARQLCDALTAIHEQGVVHRDLKPENVFVTCQAQGERVKLLDFGVASLPGPEGDAQGRVEAVVGTLQYMAPEQAAAEHVDHRSDLYSLGVIVFELVTGRLPLRGETTRAMLRQLLHVAPLPLCKYVHLPWTVHVELEGLLARCLEKDPALRPRSAAEVALELDDVIGGLPPRGGTGHRDTLRGERPPPECMLLRGEVDSPREIDSRTAPSRAPGRRGVAGASNWSGAALALRRRRSTAR